MVISKQANMMKSKFTNPEWFYRLGDYCKANCKQ